MARQLTLVRYDQDFVRRQLEAGAEDVVVPRGFCECDTILQFCREHGLDQIVEAMGVPDPRSGVETKLTVTLLLAKALLGFRSMLAFEPVLRNPHLLRQIGFNLVEIEHGFRRRQGRKRRSKGAIHRDTLANGMRRIDLAAWNRAFQAQLRVLARYRQIEAAGVFAIDSTDILVKGRTFEGTGERWNPKTSKMERGFKLTAVVQCVLGREYVVAALLAPLNVSDHELFLPAIEQAVSNLGVDRIKVIVADRGFLSGGTLYRPFRLGSTFV